MAIVLDTVTLPQGLIWEDEFAWSSLAQSAEYSLTGALIVERATRQAGRPITLVGGQNFTWITRVDLLALQALLATDATMTLTLHDARTFSVIIADAEPLQVRLLPRVLDSGPADPSSGAWYVLETLKLIEV